MDGTSEYRCHYLEIRENFLKLEPDIRRTNINPEYERGETYSEHWRSEQYMHGLSNVCGMNVVVVGVRSIVVLEVQQIRNEHGRRNLEGLQAVRETRPV